MTFGFRQIDIHGIILGTEDELVLSLVENGIHWSILKLFFILVNSFDLFRFIIVVKLEELIPPEEKESVGVISIKLELDAGISELPVSQFFNLEFARGILLVNSDFSNLDLIFDQLLADGNTDLFLVLGDGLVEDLDAFVAVWDLPLLSDDAEILIVINNNIRLVSHHISIISGEILSQGTLVVFGIGGHLEVMIVLTSVDLEAGLIGFVGNAESYSCSEHHL